jgi:hypothetical protein
MRLPRDHDRINARPVISTPKPDTGRKLRRREGLALVALALLMMAVWVWMLTH